MASAADGYRRGVRTFDEAGRTSGTPTAVVLVHGARTSRTMWAAQLAALTASGRPAEAIDLPGHGTRAQERFTVAGGLAAIDAAADRLGGRIAVVGLSLGGYVATAWAAERPAAGLVASGCSTDPRTPARWLWRQAVRLIDRLPDGGAWLNATLVRAALPSAGAADLAAGGFTLGVMADVLDEVGRLRPRDLLARTSCPVWLVNGRWDHFRGDERSFARAAPQGRVVVVPGATHLVPLVRPVAYNRVLLDVLAEIDRREATSA